MSARKPVAKPATALRTRVSRLFATTLLLVAGSGEAMEFESFEVEGQRILLAKLAIYGRKINPPGEAAQLRALLNNAKLARQAYFQVWLHSPGGSLEEGVKIGEVLREHGMYVYVPKGAYCVSACTVAFLGGTIRDMHPEATYEVHAYSRVSDASEKATRQLLEDVQGPAADHALIRFVNDSSTSGAQWAERLFRYAQQMLGGRPDERALKDVRERMPDFAAHYKQQGQLEKDLAAIKHGGQTAAQKILMRIERDSFNLRRGFLAKHAAQIGERSDHALKVLEIMFASGIQNTFAVDRTTLRERGYINVADR